MSHNGLSLDRTLGTVASASLALGLYRVLSKAIKSDGGKVSNSNLLHLVKVCLGSLMLGKSNALQDIEDMEEMVHTGELVKFQGSCHCRSVLFTLRAPETIIAKDCQGKIRYPHYKTTAESFQLIAGTKYLSVYYVNLPKASTAAEPIVAAHTFCSRCGVHILRAPNSNTDKLEVNTNCLESQSSIKEIRYDSTTNVNALGSGRAIEAKLNRHNTPNHHLMKLDDDEKSWMEDETFLKSMQRPVNVPTYKGTPATSENSSGILLAAESEDDVMSVSDVSSLHSRISHRSSRSRVSHYSTSYNARSMSMNDNASISGWAVGSALKSSDNMSVSNLSTRSRLYDNDGGISLPNLPYVEKTPLKSNANLPPSALLKDKLKHYMKKHNNSSSSRRRANRTESIEEETPSLDARLSESLSNDTKGLEKTQESTLTLTDSGNFEIRVGRSEYSETE
ncbi:hypothetical protein CTEN210_16195 [Chaetoceros tenuissimus]|uniref:CENP-V/GFA domain-containing protein n=1 Tax=Chaetoceros tenuissimus TaxID=426638 RepID=A0AAD3HE08_9STRA|nr:hypothetical protein CTEN210_16195 [Chaetoceros tenuissimus]